MEKGQYNELGISTRKKLVEKAFKDLIDNHFPFAFCNIVYDSLLKGFAITLKKDGSGSKPVYRVIYYLETGDASILEDDAEDAYAMAAGDAGASGLLTQHIMADTIDINKFNVDKEVILNAIKKGFKKVIALHRQHGIEVFCSGGETADLPIQQSSYTLNVGITARGPVKEVVTGETQVDDIIYGLASDGQAQWEKKPNSGIMANGLTLGASVLMHVDYSEKYPFLTHPKKPYQGKFYLHETPDELNGMSVGEAILSPTRQWAVVMKMIIEELKKTNSFHVLHGMTMNTGGGSTKILRLGEYIHYKKRMPVPPGIFQLIQREGGVEWKEMFEDFNSGVGVDVIGSPEGGYLEDALKKVSEKSGINVYELGKCTRSKNKKNTVYLETPYGNFHYFG